MRMLRFSGGPLAAVLLEREWGPYGVTNATRTLPGQIQCWLGALQWLKGGRNLDRKIAASASSLVRPKSAQAYQARGGGRPPSWMAIQYS